MARRPRVVVPRIQPGDPEAEGLVACYVAVPGGMLDLVSGLNGTRVGTADPTRSTELGTLETFYDGNGDSWGFGSTPLLSTTSPFTIAFESTLDSFADTYPGILQLETSAAANEFLIFYSSDGSYSDIAIGAPATWAKGRASLTDIASVTGERHWVVVTYNGSGAGTLTNFSMFVNGRSVSLSSIALAFGATTDGNAIGDHLGSANGDWHGGIRQVRVYDRVWSENEAIRFWHPSSRDSLFAPTRRNGVSASGGNVTYDLTTAAFGFIGNSQQPKSQLTLTTASNDFTANSIQPKTVVGLAAGALNFTANAITVGGQTIIDLSQAAFNFTANAVTLIKDTAIQLTTAAFNFVANAINISTPPVSGSGSGGGMFMALAGFFKKRRYRQKIGKNE